MPQRRVVTCFVQYGGRILVLKRSRRVRTHPCKWAAVSGGLETVSPLEQALREIREELGLDASRVRCVRQGRMLEVCDPENDVEWLVNPFLFTLLGEPCIRLNWENDEYRWIDPADLSALDTVPRLEETWERLSRP